MPYLTQSLRVISIVGALALSAAAGHATADKPNAETHDTIIIKVIKTKGVTAGAPTPPTPPTPPTHGGSAVHVTKCEGGARTIDSTVQSKDAERKTTTSHVILCARNAKDSPDLARLLSKARQKIIEGTELDSDLKAKVLAALDEQIAQTNTKVH